MKTILLLHGFFLTPAMWQPQRTVLEALGHRVLVPTLPPTLDPHASVDTWSALLAQLIATESPSPITVAGLSMGGYLLMALLRNYPHLVSAAIFLDTKAELDSPDARAARLAMADDVLTHDTAAAIQTMLPKLLHKNSSDSLRSLLLSIMQTVPPAAVAACQRAMAARIDQTSLFPTLKIPTLFLVGTEDALTPPALLKPLATKTPNSRYLEIPSAAHMSNLENPAAVNTALIDFIESLP